MSDEFGNEKTAGATRGERANIDDLFDENFGDDTSVTVQIRRISPTTDGMAGFLGRETIPVERIEDLPDVVAAKYGGGVYSVQPKRRGPDGQVRFSRCYQLQIAGQPISPQRGERVTVQQTPATGANVILPTAPPSQNDLLMGLFADVMAKLIPGGQPPAVVQTPPGPVDVVGMVQALAGTLQRMQQPQRNDDPFGQIERVLSLADRLRGDSPRESSSDAPEWLGAAIQAIGNFSRPAPALRAANPSPPPPPGWAFAGGRWQKLADEDDDEDDDDDDVEPDAADPGSLAGVHHGPRVETADDIAQRIRSLSPDEQAKLYALASAGKI